MKSNSETISMHYSTKDPYRIYGITHFIQKYGLSLNTNTETAINVIYGNSKDLDGFNIRIEENQMQNDVQGYLIIEKGEEKIPLFEKPIKFNENGITLVTYVDEDTEYPCVISKDSTITIGFDIFYEVGHILAGYLEHFRGSKSLKMKNALVKIPVVDYYEKILFDSLLFASDKINIPLKYKPFWPDGKKFAVCLTHDVDRVKKTYQYVTHTIKNIKKGQLSLAFSQLSFLLRRENPYWNFDRIMEIEQRLGVKSTFFFLNEQRKFFCLPGEWKLYWGRYDIKDAKIVETIKRLNAEGWEIGIHGSYNSYKDLDMLEEEKKVLEEMVGKKVKGISQHYCNLETPKTWEYHEKVGLTYDSTIGFVGEIGFKYGTCFPFHPFNPAEGRTLSLWELPIIIMDNACAFDKGDVWSEINNVLNNVEKYNGLLLLRWHQCIFNEREFPGRGSIYGRIIKKCKEKEAWITNASSIAEWLRMRDDGKNQIQILPNPK